MVGLELAEISRAHPVGRGFDLHAEKVCAVLDADVVGSRFSPWPGDGEAASGRLRHELQLDPFAALFESLEVDPVVVVAVAAFPCTHPCVNPLCSREIPTLLRSAKIPTLRLRSGQAFSRKGRARNGAPGTQFGRTSSNKKGATFGARLPDQ